LAEAELIEDGGEAASSVEFFRCPPYLAAEEATHTLRVEAADGVLVAPLIVRAVPGGEGRDAVSPYGYPGVVPTYPGGAIEAGDVDWSATGLVSLFLRGTALGPYPLPGAERGTLQISDPAEERKSRMSDRQQIRRNEASGFVVETLPGPEVSADQKSSFEQAYEETMTRTDAAPRYFFGSEWFEAVFSSRRTWLVLVNSPDGDVAAGSIGALSDGVLHYFLSGTADDHLHEAPMKNAIVALQDLSDELGAPLNLGGGLRPGDGLEEFKRGFANRQAPFIAHEVICDPDAYDRLSTGCAAGDFFPAYRAPG